MTEVKLEPCPWCGVPLTVAGGCNPYGRCDTEGCWMHERAIAITVDDQRQVAAWNKRHRIQSTPTGGEERAREWGFAARFWSLVEVGSPAECWPWRRSLSNGYPTLRVNGETRRATQIAWEFANGRGFPSGRFALHRCDNPPCCNPAHLFVGTNADNMRDMSAKGRAAGQAQTHCRNGHEFTPENTRIRMRDGAARRVCRACQRGHCRKWRTQRKEESNG